MLTHGVVLSVFRTGVLNPDVDGTIDPTEYILHEHLAQESNRKSIAVSSDLSPGSYLIRFDGKVYRVLKL